MHQRQRKRNEKKKQLHKPAKELILYVMCHKRWASLFSLHIGIWHWYVNVTRARKRLQQNSPIFFFFFVMCEFIIYCESPFGMSLWNTMHGKKQIICRRVWEIGREKKTKKKKMTTKNVIACATKCIKPTHGSKKIARKGGSEREKKFKKKNTQSRNVNTSCHFLINKTIFPNIFIVYYFRLFYHSKGNPYGI